eukprot:5762-Heterococcus_DN1.PRE.2
MTLLFAGVGTASTAVAQHCCNLYTSVSVLAAAGELTSMLQPMWVAAISMCYHAKLYNILAVAMHQQDTIVVCHALRSQVVTAARKNYYSSLKIPRRVAPLMLLNRRFA